MRTPADLRSLARAHTEVGIKILAGIAMNEEFPPAARVSAVAQLLDRGWGKAVRSRSPAIRTARSSWKSSSGCGSRSEIG